MLKPMKKWRFRNKTLAPLGRTQPQGSREVDSQWNVEDLWLQQGDGHP